MLKRKHIALWALAFTLLFGANAQAGGKIKYLQVGDTVLQIEAPEDTCFVNQTNEGEQAMFQALEAKISASGKKQLVAAFADCNNIMRFLEDQNMLRLSEKVTFISWLNPEVGFSFQGTRPAFLKMQEAKLKEKGRKDYKLMDNSIAYLVRQSYKLDDQQIDQVVVSGYTTIRNLPLEIVIQDSTKDFTSGKSAFDKIEQFVKYQIKLNE